MKQIYDYFVHRYGNNNSENLHQMIASLERKVADLQRSYDAALDVIKRLEEENAETSNVLHQLQNDINAVDYRIDILMSDDSLKVTEREDGSLDIYWNPADPRYSFLSEMSKDEQREFFINAIEEALKNVG